MPIVEPSSYTRAPLYQINGHFQTIFPSLLRRIDLNYQRERIELEDGDFLDLDWLYTDRKKLIVLTHGLEGNSERIYVKGMARKFTEAGWDALAWNCRSCSEELNRTFRLYHHGDIEDIGYVIEHAIKKGYETIVLVGFSMGGNITLKYLGVHGQDVPNAIKAGIAFSTPCDLEGSSSTLDKRENFLYRKKFLGRLKEKIMMKAEQFPGRIDLSNFDKIKVWKDFDEYYSAPLTNYENAAAFYAGSSANNYIEGIKVPSLLVNAKNDPLLTETCFPTAMAIQHPYLFLEAPEQGGHVGFDRFRRTFNWAEDRTLDFVNEVL